MYVIMPGTIGGVLKYVKRKCEKGRERERYIRYVGIEIVYFVIQERWQSRFPWTEDRWCEKYEQESERHWYIYVCIHIYIVVIIYKYVQAIVFCAILLVECNQILFLFFYVDRSEFTFTLHEYIP